MQIDTQTVRRRWWSGTYWPIIEILGRSSFIFPQLRVICLRWPPTPHPTSVEEWEIMRLFHPPTPRMCVTPYLRAILGPFKLPHPTSYSPYSHIKGYSLRRPPFHSIGFLGSKVWSSKLWWCRYWSERWFQWWENTYIWERTPEEWPPPREPSFPFRPVLSRPLSSQHVRMAR